MEKIEVVINITKHEWEYLNKLVENGDQLGHYERLLVNGTPLPKGHGRIADVDKMLDEMRATRTYDILFALERVKPIIEADKAESEDKQ